FDHTGVGISFDGNSNNSAGYSSVMIGMGTYRPETVPANPNDEYIPTVRDFDVVVGNMDLLLSDFVFLNPYKALRSVGAYNWTKLKMRNVKGQPIYLGYQIELAGDFYELQFHWWPYWCNDARVRQW